MLAVLLLAMNPVLIGATASGTPTNAHDLLAASARAMMPGGPDALRALRTVDYTSVGHRAMVEQSERPTGPFLLDDVRTHVERDERDGRTRIESEDRGYAGDVWWLQQTEASKSTTITDATTGANVDATGKQSYAGRGAALELRAEDFAFSPEHVILTALDAPDAALAPDIKDHGVPEHVVTFTWHGAPCRLIIDGNTLLPWQISYRRSYSQYIFLAAWGDVPTTTTFTEWSLEPNGMHYPRQWTTQRLDLPDTVTSIVQLRFDAPMNDADLQIDPAIRSAHPSVAPLDELPFGGPSPAPVTIAPGVVQVPFAWNVEFVDQSDGVVMIEGPISPAYTNAALAYARAHYGKPIKALVTTSDSWPHIAGVRQAVAEGVPVYAVDLNLPILRRLIAAPHAQRPDDLERTPRTADIRAVTGPTTIGSGDTQLVLLPYRSATAERQMMVYVPHAHALYTSDLFAPDGNGGWFTPQYLSEMFAAVKRYGLDPETIFGMHYGPTKFADVRAWLDAFLARKPASTKI